MNDVTVTIVGNALTAPEIRRTNSTNTLVSTFRVASTSRRYDRDAGRWVDGPSLRVRVTCWRRLAEGVSRSVRTGDPLVVTGRLYTRDWVGEDGQHRVSYELEALAVGHDLSRGYAEFTRHRAAGPTVVIEDAAADARVRDESSVPVDSLASPRRGDVDEYPGGGDEFADDPVDGQTEGSDVEADAMRVLQTAGLADQPPAGPDLTPAERDGGPGAGEPAGRAGDDAAHQPAGGSDRPAPRRGRARVPVPV